MVKISPYILHRSTGSRCLGNYPAYYARPEPNGPSPCPFSLALALLSFPFLTLELCDVVIVVIYLTSFNLYYLSFVVKLGRVYVHHRV